MSLPPNEQHLAQHILESMGLQLARGLRFQRGSLGFGYVGIDPTCGCALGADLFFFLRDHKALLERCGPRIFSAYHRRFGVDEWFVEGITVGFDAEGGEPSTYAAGIHEAHCYPVAGDCTPLELAARDRGRTVGLFLAQWVDANDAWQKA